MSHPAFHKLRQVKPVIWRLTTSAFMLVPVCHFGWVIVEFGLSCLSVAPNAVYVGQPLREDKRETHVHDNLADV